MTLIHRPGDAERELRKRFTVRMEAFHHADLALEMLLPDSAEALIDEAEFERDERLPYWAELWPSARALARHLVENPVLPDCRAIELGCGVGLPSLVLAARGNTVLATDYEADALAFSRANAERNQIAGLEFSTLDWRCPEETQPFDLVLAADVLYEKRNALALAAVLPRLLSPVGVFLLADPGRVYFDIFRDTLVPAGWSVERIEEREEISDAATGAISRISLYAVQHRHAARAGVVPQISHYRDRPKA